MKLRLLTIGLALSGFAHAASPSSSALGVVPSAGNGVIPWSTLQSYLTASKLLTSNFSGFQLKESSTYYYLGDNKLAVFKAACAQAASTPASSSSQNQPAEATVPLKQYSGETWIDAALPVSEIAASLLHTPRFGSIFSYQGNYVPFSTLFKNTGVNNLQLNAPLITQMMSQQSKSQIASGAPTLNAYYLESMAFMYPVLIQNYIGRVYTGATALQPLFNFSGTYNNQTVNNAIIQQNFLAACTYALECSQYALAAFGQPVDVTQGTFSPTSGSTKNATQSGPPSGGPQSVSFGNASNYSLGGPSTSAMTSPSQTSATSTTPAGVTPVQGQTMSILDTFAGVILINSVPTTKSGTTWYTIGFGPETLPTSAAGLSVTPTPQKPYGVIFSGQSGFIPVAGNADNWSPTTNGIEGRSIGVCYTVCSQSSPTSSTAVVPYGSTAFDITVTFGEADTVIQVYASGANGSNQAMTPITTINLEDFFVVPTPWALVVNVAGFVTSPSSQVSTPCLYITPAALTSSTQTTLQQYITNNQPTSCVTLSGVLCQSNNQPIPQTPDIVGIVKLNPYDFPFQFTQASNITSPQYNPPTATAQQTQATASQSGLTFSMRDIYDAAASVYAKAFPDGYHAVDKNGYYANISSYVTANSSGQFQPYGMGYLILQGLCNGYLMMSQATAPLITPLQAPYTLGTDLGKNMTGLSTFGAQYPQPTEIQWFATPGFDYAMARALMIMRYFVRTMYVRSAAIPYIQQILKNPNMPYQPLDSSGKPAGSMVYFGQNPAVGYSYNVYAAAQAPTYTSAVVCAAAMPAAPSSTSVGTGSTTGTSTTAGTSPAPTSFSSAPSSPF